MRLSLIPWAVREEHRGKHLYRMLERESLRREGLPCGTQEEYEQVVQWTERLRSLGAVVDYRPWTEQGFFLTYARPQDVNLVRVPDSP